MDQLKIAQAFAFDQHFRQFGTVDVVLTSRRFVSTWNMKTLLSLALVLAWSLTLLLSNARGGSLGRPRFTLKKKPLLKFTPRCGRDR